MLAYLKFSVGILKPWYKLYVFYVSMVWQSLFM